MGKRVRALGLVIAVSLAAAGRSGAEPLVGLTDANVLIRFDSTTPATVQTIGPVTGLVPGDDLIGIDRRPSLGPNNGRLYAIGVNAGAGRVYILDETTAVATLVAPLAADPADVTAPFPFTTVSGTSFAIDFNPVADRLRVVSDLEQNLRINVDTGLVQLDVPVAYQGQTDPTVVGVAYSNNFGGAQSTALQGVEIGLDPILLVAVTNPNGGSLETLGSLSFGDALENASFDISGTTGSRFFAVTPTGGVTSLWSNDAGLDLLGVIGAGLELVGLTAGVGGQLLPADSDGPDCDEIPDCPDPQHLPDSDEK